MVSCSHKKNVLYFLEHLCSFYEQKYILASSVAAESTQTFIDKVYDLADANELPLKVYKSIFSEFSADKVKKQLNKVFIYTYLVFVLIGICCVHGMDLIFIFCCLKWIDLLDEYFGLARYDLV